MRGLKHYCYTHIRYLSKLWLITMASRKSTADCFEIPGFDRQRWPVMATRNDDWFSVTSSFWLVLSAGWCFGTCLICPCSWEINHPNWLSYFSEGVKPPTRCVLFRFTRTLTAVGKDRNDPPVHHLFQGGYGPTTGRASSEDRFSGDSRVKRLGHERWYYSWKCVSFTSLSGFLDKCVRRIN